MNNKTPGTCFRLNGSTQQPNDNQFKLFDSAKSGQQRHGKQGIPSAADANLFENHTYLFFHYPNRSPGLQYIEFGILKRILLVLIFTYIQLISKVLQYLISHVLDNRKYDLFSRGSSETSAQHILLYSIHAAY